jgi:hypothetical protein
MSNEDSSTSAEQDEDRLFVIVLIKVFSRFAASLERANRCQVVLEHSPLLLSIAGFALINGLISEIMKQSTLRLPGLKARACSGLTLSRAFSPRSLRTGLGAAERVEADCEREI